MHSKPLFRTLLVFLGIAVLFMAVEFATGDSSDRARMQDLSATSRAYNNILAMILFTIAMALPLTANIYTAKLIDVFLRDRINQGMLFFVALLSAHAIWIFALAGLGRIPVWAVYVAEGGAALSFILLIPYFFYIVRFADPSNILARLQHEIVTILEEARHGRVPAAQAKGLLVNRAQVVSTILLKTIDRAERGVMLDGIATLEGILATYRDLKPGMPADWFRVDPNFFVGLSEEALESLEQDHTWVEHIVLSHLFLGYQSALAKSQDAISSLSEAVRQIALHSLEVQDDKALAMATKFFNNFLREAIKRKDLHALYNLMYQYRMLATTLEARPALLRKIGGYLRDYSEWAEMIGIPFFTQMVAIDLGVIIRHAFEHKSPVAHDLLATLLELKHHGENNSRPLITTAKLMLGGFLVERGLDVEVQLLRANLSDLRTDLLARLEGELMTTEDSSYREITDRHVVFEWVPPAQRPFLQAFIQSIYAERRQPG